MEVGWGIGDGGERYHDEIGVDFDLTSVHDAGLSLLDCTANSILRLVGSAPGPVGLFINFWRINSEERGIESHRQLFFKWTTMAREEEGDEFGNEKRK